ncbi:MFS general substrate transporter, partial [Ramicandelaber brevisporus]
MSSAPQTDVEYASVEAKELDVHTEKPRSLGNADDAATDVEAGTATANTVQKPVVSRQRFLIIFVGICLAMLLGALDNTIVSTALPAIAFHLESFDSISWVATIYLLASTSLQPVVGKFSDIFGRKVVYLGSIILFLIGSALCGAAQSIGMLIAARAIQGVGASGLFGISMIIILDLTSVQEASQYTGLLGSVFAIA